MSGDTGHREWGRGVLLASGGQGPGILLNIIHGSGQPLQQTLIWPKCP